MPNYRKTQQKCEEYAASRGYELRSEYTGFKNYVDIYCPGCRQIFTMTWNGFYTKERDCSNCKTKFKKKMRTPFTKVQEEFESKLNILLSVEEDYTDRDTMLKCICVCGRKCTKSYGNVLYSSGRCIKCSGEKRGEKQKNSNNIADEIVSNRGIKILEYSYKNIRDPFPLECLTCKFQFEMSLESVRNGNGCPKCRCSYGEFKLLQYMQIMQKYFFIDISVQYKVSHDPDNDSPGCRRGRYDLPFDMLIKPFDGHEMLIEIDGIQHFKPVKFYGGPNKFIIQRECDIIKSLYCLNNNIQLLRVAYSDIDNLVEIVIGFIRKNRYKKENCLYYSDLNTYAGLINNINLASVK